LKTWTAFCFATLLAASSLAAKAEHGLCTDKDFPIKNFHTVALEGIPPAEVYDCDKDKGAKGLVYRGSRPNKKGIEALVSSGVKTDLDLEEGDAVKNEEKLVDGRMTFVSVLMSGSSGSSDETVSELIPIITNPANYPLYIHCERGIDRTGFVVGMLRIAEGWEAARATTEWNQFRDLQSDLFSRGIWTWGQAQIKKYFDELNPTPISN
jgi:hypothetical protein